MVDDRYLDELVHRVTSILRGKLRALYVIGSTSLGDYIPERSDLDILGITSTVLTDGEKDRLANTLDQENLSCPADGLDMVLLAEPHIQEIKPEPFYEFWFSTGAKWPREDWSRGASSEMLIFLELARQNGVKIYEKGPPFELVKINRDLLGWAFGQILHWHKQYILDDYHDPRGQNSVLNACRILLWADTNKFFSKSQGGEAYRKRYPANLLVEKALSIRQQQNDRVITRQEVMEFIELVERKLAAILLERGL